MAFTELLIGVLALFIVTMFFQQWRGNRLRSRLESTTREVEIIARLEGREKPYLPEIVRYLDMDRRWRRTLLNSEQFELSSLINRSLGNRSSVEVLRASSLI